MDCCGTFGPFRRFDNQFAGKDGCETRAGQGGLHAYSLALLAYRQADYDTRSAGANERQILIEAL